MPISEFAREAAEIYRRMATPVPRVTWTPVRYVREPQLCSLCLNAIPAGKPGATTGSRGTRAWFCAEHRVWECLACRSAAVDAELDATRAIGDLFGSVVPAPQVLDQIVTARDAAHGA